MLFVEAARGLGFGARIVSGYLYNPDPHSEQEAGTTHAWAEVFVPGAGWITFDPTNRGVGGFNLIPVAVGRDIHQAMPVAGSFTGMTDAFQGLWVDVSVTSERHAAADVIRRRRTNRVLLIHHRQRVSRLRWLRDACAPARRCEVHA